jgi:hypothetical protein
VSHWLPVLTQSDLVPEQVRGLRKHMRTTQVADQELKKAR